MCTSLLKQTYDQMEDKKYRKKTECGELEKLGKT
jgi:hypothetical protein